MFNIKNSKAKVQKLEWEDAEEVKKDIEEILEVLEFSHINPQRIFCFRSYGSKSRSYARIWTFPKIFQRALDLKPAYVIEVLAKYYDHLDEDNRKKVLIHELLHIPKNFSGALVPHKGRNRSLGKQANLLFEQYKQSLRVGTLKKLKV